MVKRIDFNHTRSDLNHKNFPIDRAFSRSPGARYFDKSKFDDIIRALADAHENRRARQVCEWERMNYQNARVFY